MSGAADRSILARNTVWSAVGYGFQFLVPIFLVPFIVGHVGKEAYGGVWVTLFTLASWVGFYDLGLWGSIPKDVAERRAQNDPVVLRTLWATWLWYDLVLGTLTVAGVSLCAPWIVHRFSTVSDPSSPLLFIGLAAQAAIGPLLRHLNATLNGLQRLDLVNLMAMLITPFWVGGQVGVLLAGWGLPGLMWNGLVFGVIQVFWLVILIAREGYPVTFSPAHFSRAELRRLLAFGWKLQAQMGINQAFRNDRVVMGNQQAAGVTIAAYQFGSNIVDRLSGSITVLSAGVLSAASDLAARGDTERVRLLFLRGTKYHALAAFGLLGFAALFGHELMMFWMGEPLPESVLVLRIMAAGGIATAIGSCGQSVAVALGRPGWTTLTSALGLVATVFLYMGVGHRYDYVGLAASVSAGLVLIQIVFMSGLRRFLEFHWREYVGNALIKPAVLAVPLGAVYAAWGAAASHFPPVDSRLRAFLVLAPAFALSALLGWAMARALNVVDDVDVDVIKSSGRRSVS